MTVVWTRLTAIGMKSGWRTYFEDRLKCYKEDAQQVFNKRMNLERRERPM